MSDHQVLDDVHRSGYAASHCSRCIPNAPNILWADQPRLRLQFTIYHIPLIAVLLYWSSYFGWEAHRLWQLVGEVSIWNILLGTLLFYFAIPYYIVQYYRLKNTYFALTPTTLWKVVYKKATPFELAHMRNIVHIPTEGSYGNLGFLYRKGYDWKHQSLKDVPQSGVLYEAVMQQLESAKTP